MRSLSRTLDSSQRLLPTIHLPSLHTETFPFFHMTPPTSTNAEISAVTDKDSNTQVPVSAGFCRSLTMQGLRRVGIADLAGGRRASRNAGQERSSECRVIACCPWFHNSRRRAGARSSRAVPDAACGRASALVKRQNDVGEDVEGAAGGSSCTQILAQSLTYACKHALIASSAAGALPDLLVHGGGYNFASRCTPDVGRHFRLDLLTGRRQPSKYPSHTAFHLDPRGAGPPFSGAGAFCNGAGLSCFFFIALCHISSNPSFPMHHSLC